MLKKFVEMAEHKLGCALGVQRQNFPENFEGVGRNVEGRALQVCEGGEKKFLVSVTEQERAQLSMFNVL